MYINTRLSSKVAYGFTGGPEYSTIITPHDNGDETRNSQWLYPKHRYTAQFKNFEKPQQQEIIAAFHVMKGRWGVCRLKDWNDFTGESLDGAWEPTLAPTTGTSTPAQLLKIYGFGTEGRTRPIQAPIESTITIYCNDVEVDVTIDDETGLVTPDDPWPVGTYRWTGDHDVWVRFGSDYNAFAINDFRVATADVELVEVRRRISA